MSTTDHNPFAVEARRATLSGPVLRTLAMLAVCCLAVYVLHVASRSWLLSRLSYGLESHSSSVQQERLAMLSEFGSDGLPILVAAIASNNENLSVNAFRTVSEMQGRWQSATLTKPGKLNLALVQAVSEQLATCPPERRSRLATLVNQTLLDTVDSADTQDRESYTIATKLIGLLGPATKLPTEGTQERIALLADEVRESEFAGENELSDIPQVAQGQLLRPAQTRLLPVEMDSAELEATRSIVLPETQENTLEPSPLPWHAPEDNPLVRDLRAPEPLIDAITENPLEAFDLRSVMEFLAREHQSLAETAIEELMRRGLSADEIEIAKRMMSPDVGVKLALVDELPKRTDVDPRQWLMWLSSDDSRQVRLEAISRLGSMGDPDITKALQERLRSERDLIVASRLRKVLNVR